MKNKWEDAIKKIPQIDEYELEGIKHWRISDFEMIPIYDGIHEKSFREEAARLIDAGFNLAINTENGVGSVLVRDDGFTIELWQYNNKRLIHKASLDEVLDWVIYFYDN